ncbi:MAG: hypothetical protein MUO40_12455 [Anaerolineaceae bacterium]|nr:hypothetical protein [Anaerolineaceae bacterium]
MNDKQLEKKFQNDVENMKQDLDTLVKNNTSKISQGYEKLKGEAIETLGEAADTVKKEIGHGLSQYNAKAQEYANKIPGDLVDKVTKYPWVAITVGLVIGMILGGLLRPSRRA